MGEAKKSNFSLTCSRLSQYLKEKRSFGDLGILEICSSPQEPNNKGTFRPPATISFLHGAGVSAETETGTAETGPISDRNAQKSRDLFSLQNGLAPGGKNNVTMEQEKAHQLTIFYNGKVLVFDHFPVEKASDLMQLAAKVSPEVPLAVPPTATASADQARASSSSAPTPAQPSPDLPMPIARRASLHRFLEKRKDRVVSKAPYQVNSPASGGSDSGKPEETRNWLGLGPDVSKPDSN